MYKLFFLFKRNSLFTVRQINPELHHESVDDVNNVRNQSSLTPSAPSQEDAAALRRLNLRTHSQLNCPICLANATLPIETNCGHVFCGKIILITIKQLQIKYGRKILAAL